MKRVALIFVCFTFGPTLAPAEEKGEKFTLCRLGKIVRTIRVEKAESNEEACRTTYTKAGVDRVVGSGKHFGSCHRVLENIRGNLTEASWKCRDIEQDQVIVSEKPSPRKISSN